MAELVNMPKLGFDMREGQLVKWVKQVGDTVKTGEIIAEIESDKATVEVEAFVSGTILSLLVNEGDWVPIGAPIAVVGEPGEAVDLAALGVAQAAQEGGAPVQAPAAPSPAPAVPAPATGDDGSGLPEGVRASPLARRLAEERGIDIRQITGTGPQGRIVKADIEAFQGVSIPAPAPPPLTPVAVSGGDEVIPTPRMRARIAARMVESKTTIPHFYITSEVDMGAAMELRADLNARIDSEDKKVSVNDMIIKAAALALREFPNLNSSFNGDTLIRHARINIGIAVALDEGLINVVSQDADRTPLTVMAVTHRALIARAREGRIKPEDVEGETFSVSNLGGFDVENFAAIINPPAAAILAVGTARRVPVVQEDGTISAGWRMKMTLSADHRVTDGAEAARFMQRVKQILEDPLRMLM
jgi:pyruvate dehydrogenase E2 component (dihydrolipoamide acetyltransferase)